jgi:ABC-2 type transport system permease protein
VTRVLHAEWTKLRTTPGLWALLIAVVAGTAGIGAAADSCAGPVCGTDLPKLSLTGVQLGQAVVAVLAVLVMGNEYSTGLIRLTLSAVPRRGLVLFSKALLTAGLIALTSVVAVACSLLLGHLLVAGYSIALRPALGSVLYLVLVGLLSLGLATAVRQAAAAVGVVLALLYAVPIVTGVVTDPTWQRRLERAGPATAGLAVQVTGGDAVIGPWWGLGVLALWSLGALLLGWLTLTRRDA